MNILLIAATSAEIAPSIEYIGQAKGPDGLLNGHFTDVLVTGVGMIATCFALTRKLMETRYDLVIQAGIAGSFDRNLQIGQVVWVTGEQLGDMGAEDHYNFLDIFDLGLEGEDSTPFRNRRLETPRSAVHQLIGLPEVSSLTINTVSGSSFTAEARHRKYGCQIESMEGAAFHYVCLQMGIPFAQVRSISNYVEARDRSKWKIGDAVTSLNGWLREFLEKL